MINPAGTGIDKGDASGPFFDDFDGFGGAFCDGVDGMVVVQFQIKYQGSVFKIDVTQDAEEVIHLNRWGFSREEYVVCQADPVDAGGF